VAPKPVTPPRKTQEAPPPPPKFQETDKNRVRRPLPKVASSEQTPLSDAFELTPLSFELGEDSGGGKSEDPFPFIPTRDTSLASSQASASSPAPSELAPDAPKAPVAPSPEPAAFAPPPPVPEPVAAAPEPPASPEPAAPAPAETPETVEVPPEPPPATEAIRPTGRALADLYYAQGHYAEALQIYDDLVTRHPFDEELKRMRRDAEARLLPAATAPSAAAPDIGLERRLSRIRALKQWLSIVQAG